MNQKFKEARHLIEVRLVSPKGTLNSQIRTALMQIGFNKISLSNSYLDALTESKSTTPAIVFFDGENPDSSNVPAQKFVGEMTKIGRSPALIAFFVKPSGQKLFELLKCGAKGFLLAPFTAGAIEEAFERVQQGFTVSDDVLAANTPQEAFARIIYHHLNILATDVKPRRKQLGNPEVLEEEMKEFKDTIMMAKLFSDSNVDGLFDRLYLEFIENAEKFDREAQQTRLRKTREMLKAKRRQS